MTKKQKKAVNISMILVLLASFGWGTVARGLGTWGTNSYSQWWNNDIFWANVCQIIIPITIVVILFSINRKK